MAQRAFFIAGLVALVLVVGACTDTTPGNITSTSGPTPTAAPVPTNLPPDFAIIWEAYEHLKRDSVHRNTLDSHDLAQGAVRGMMLALDDPYASFLDQAARAIQEEDYTGSFAGIGADVTLRDGVLTIISPMEGSPAESAGLRPGDAILTVNGESLHGLTLLEQVAKVRGPAGSPVTVGLLRPGATQMEEVTIIRQAITVSSVSWTPLEGGLAHLRIRGFVRTTDGDVVKALREIKTSGAKGVVLDLRNNPGGFLDTTVHVASQFLKDGLVLYEIDGAGQRTDWKVERGGVLPDLPLVVLVNEGSASGAEVLSGALQSHGRARLIGEKTFGKGSVNITRDLQGGAAIVFTIARWYTPDGRLIEGQGLAPDIPVGLDPAKEGDEQMAAAVKALSEALASGTRAAASGAGG